MGKSYLTVEWWENDRKEYNKGVALLPTLTVSNASPEVIQHMRFQGEEIVRLRETIAELIKSVSPSISNKSKKG